ncbi:hypothetical protein KP509_23G004500 [Ceratopteris richardii]|uniref:ACB domain-containing protein n=1 Tax=Ceratopteris richardii TaxID=49495 RepID=A0A8T2RWH7_CERRI|nr:hypothetical protein KP509_23G004500 [Ceratopteris richardii]
MARSGPPYPHRFFAAAAYSGFGPQASSPSLRPRLSDEIIPFLYALYQQATIGPCKAPKPQSRSQLEKKGWESWMELKNMASVEAMRLFVKILEEEDPAWLSKVHGLEIDTKDDQKSTVSDAAQKLREAPLSTSQEDQLLEPVNSVESDILADTEDKDVLIELAIKPDQDKWVSPHVSGYKPTPRYQHAAEVIGNKMYVIGGNHNGRYLNDVQVLDLTNFTWSKVDLKSGATSPISSKEPRVATMFPPCAGHSLVQWKEKLLAVAGHSKDPSDTVIVRAFDVKTNSWSVLQSFGKVPFARGGQTVTLVGSNLIMFGGENSKRCFLNDLNILDLETMTWDAIEAVGTPPSPRSDHTATVQAGRYLLIFGGGSHSTCFNDLHILDLDSMEWSQPQPRGITPSPRAGHADIKVGDSWYIVGGGDNKSGLSETMVLNLSTLVWSVGASLEGSEGLSVTCAAYNGEEVLIAFGGYNGRYSNEVHIMKTNRKAKLPPKFLESPAAAAAAAAVKAAYTSQVPSANGFYTADSLQENRFEENMMDMPDPKNRKFITEEIRDQLSLALKHSADLEVVVSSLQAENARLKHDIAVTQTSNAELSKELHSIRGQLDNEQSRCFRLEVNVAELRKKLQLMEQMQNELELLHRQVAAADQEAAAAMQQQSSGGVWGWLAGSPPNGKVPTA